MCLPEIIADPQYDVSTHEHVLVDEYLGKQPSVDIELLDSLLADKPPFHPDTRTLTTIPSYREGAPGFLSKTLKAYSKLRGLDQAAIIIFENHPASKERDNTKKIIEQAQHETPLSDAQILHLYHAFAEKPTVGLVRKILCDAALRQTQRSKIPHDTVMIFNDADILDISPDYLTNCVSTFDEHPEADIVRGRLVYPASVYEQIPVLQTARNVRKIFFQLLESAHPQSAEIFMLGANAAIRTGMYAAIGGFDPYFEYGEDSNLAQRAWLARGKSRQANYYSPGMFIESSPRRLIEGVAAGRTQALLRNDFHTNDAPRVVPTTFLMDKALKLSDHSEQLVRELQHMYDISVKKYTAPIHGTSIAGEQIGILLTRAAEQNGLNVYVENGAVVLQNK